MKRKTVTYAAEKAQGAPHVIAAAVGDTGRVEAYVSVFGNVDLQGDRIISTAFDRSLAKWRASGDPIPVVWSHAWGDPAMHIGTADPYKAIADVRGLLLVMQFDLADEDARKVFKLVKERRVKEWSFAYDVVREMPGKDGANELVELDIIEAGPTLKGANPLTQTLSVKSAPTFLALERANRQIDAVMNSLPPSRDPAQLDVDAFIATQKAELARERAVASARAHARERLHEHHVTNSDAPRRRVQVDERNFLVVQEDEDASERRNRDLAEVQARDATTIRTPAYFRR